jgi:hypothetical protein
VSTDVSDQHIDSKFRVKEKSEKETSVKAGGKQLFFLTLKMKAICSSETSVDSQRTTWCYIPEDGTLHNHRCQNLKSYDVTTVLQAERLAHTHSSVSVGCQFLMAVTMKGTVFWLVMPCNSERAQRFGGTYRLHLQGRRVSQALNLQVASLDHSSTLKMEVI